MAYLIICFIILIYEFVARGLPTSRNLSLLDGIKQVIDRWLPNYKKDNFPFERHQ